MAHHPSSAELAAFRRTLGTVERRGHPSPFRHPFRGATDDEREHGIGWRDSTPDPIGHGFRGDWTNIYGQSRREANALRSRAYARLCPSDWNKSAYIDERTHGCPSPYHPAFDDEWMAAQIRVEAPGTGIVA